MTRTRLCSLIALALLGCDGAASGGDAGSPHDGASSRDANRGDTGPVLPSDSFYAACGGRIFDPSTGALDASEYDRQARLWDRAAIDCRLGPTWASLHPDGHDD